jgi:hypothetical protein
MIDADHTQNFTDRPAAVRHEPAASHDVVQ